MLRCSYYYRRTVTVVSKAQEYLQNNLEAEKIVYRLVVFREQTLAWSLKWQSLCQCLYFLSSLLIWDCTE